MVDKLSPNPGLVAKKGSEQATDIWISEVIRLVNRKMPNQADSAAATIADLRTDFNALLAKLKDAGFMESS